MTNEIEINKYTTPDPVNTVSCRGDSGGGVYICSEVIGCKLLAVVSRGINNPCKNGASDITIDTEKTWSGTSFNYYYNALRLKAYLQL